MRKGDDLTIFTVPKVTKSPEVLTFRIPRGLFRPVVGKVHLYLYLCWKMKMCYSEMTLCVRSLASVGVIVYSNDVSGPLQLVRALFNSAIKFYSCTVSAKDGGNWALVE